MRTVITVIATVFLTIDFDKVSGFFLRQIPEKQKAIMQEAKGYFGGTPSCAYAGGNAFGPAFCRVYRDARRSVPACIYKEAE